jgi:hypothetical protein
LRDDILVRFVLNVRESQKPSAFEVDMANGKMKKHKSPDVDHIHPQMIIIWVEQYIL